MTLVPTSVKSLLDAPVTLGSVLKLGSAVIAIATIWLGYLSWQVGQTANAIQLAQNPPLLAVSKVRLSRYNGVPELDLVLTNGGGASVNSFCLSTLGTFGDLYHVCSGDLGGFDIAPGQSVMRAVLLRGMNVDGRPFTPRTASLSVIGQKPAGCRSNRHAAIGLMTSYPDASGSEHNQVRWVELCE